MLNNSWVMLGGLLKTDARFSACDPVALRFEEFFPTNTRRERSFEEATIHKRRHAKEE
jgi:hypothetical protein